MNIIKKNSRFRKYIGLIGRELANGPGDPG